MGLFDNLDAWIAFVDGITRIFGEHFSALFSFCLSSVQLEYVLSHLQPKVTNEMNAELIAEFTDTEVKCALMEILQFQI